MEKCSASEYQLWKKGAGFWERTEAKLPNCPCLESILRQVLTFLPSWGDRFCDATVRLTSPSCFWSVPAWLSWSDSPELASSEKWGKTLKKEILGKCWRPVTCSSHLTPWFTALWGVTPWPGVRGRAGALPLTRLPLSKAKDSPSSTRSPNLFPSSRFNQKQKYIPSFLSWRLSWASHDSCHSHLFFFSPNWWFTNGSSGRNRGCNADSTAHHRCNFSFYTHLRRRAAGFWASWSPVLLTFARPLNLFMCTAVKAKAAQWRSTAWVFTQLFGQPLQPALTSVLCLCCCQYPN